MHGRRKGQPRKNRTEEGEIPFTGQKPATPTAPNGLGGVLSGISREIPRPKRNRECRKSPDGPQTSQISQRIRSGIRQTSRNSRTNWPRLPPRSIQKELKNRSPGEVTYAELPRPTN